MKVDILFLVTLGLAAGASVRAAPVSRSRALTRNVCDQLDIRDHHALLVVKRGDNDDLPVSSQIGPQSLAHDPNPVAEKTPIAGRTKRRNRYRASKAAEKRALFQAAAGDPTSPITQQAVASLATLNRKKAAQNRQQRLNQAAKQQAANTCTSASSHVPN
jgi:hypothetical protein